MSIFFLGLNFIETEKSFTKPKKFVKWKLKKLWHVAVILQFVW
jgi:hypothetical protein